MPARPNDEDLLRAVRDEDGADDEAEDGERRIETSRRAGGVEANHRLSSFVDNPRCSSGGGCQKCASRCGLVRCRCPPGAVEPVVWLQLIVWSLLIDEAARPEPYGRVERR